MRTIMIVDDKPENLYLMEALLINENKVIQASNGAEALGLARKSPLDLIITDILMPVMDGFTLCKEWKRDDQLKKIPLIFYTATYTDKKDEEFALSLGADLFILKPQEPEVFLSLIAEVLKKIERNHPAIQMPLEDSEVNNLKEYNQVLIRKLEDKIADSDRNRIEMARYAAQLEKEIEDRKLAETALRKSEERYRTLVDSMNEGLILVDADDQILFVNEQFCQMSGYHPDDLMGKTGYKLLFKQESQGVIIEKNKLRAKGITDSYEIKLLRKDGEEIWVKVSGTPVYSDKGLIMGSLGTFENIHEHKAISARLASEQKLFETLALVSPVGIFRTNPDGQTTYVNPKWSDLSGLTYEQAIGDDWLSAVHPDDRSLLLKSWHDSIKERTASTAEYRFLRPDGTIVWVLGNAVPEVNDGELCGYIGTITDLTERKKFEQEILIAKEKAEAGNRLKTAFLNSISHEVRTPLNGILGFGEMIIDPDITEQEKRMYLDVLQSSSDRLLKTINDFMDVSLLASGNLEVRKDLFNLNELLNQLFLIYSQKINAKTQSLKLSLPKNSANFILDSDSVLLKKVFTNLLDNAIKFTNEGTIELGYAIQGDHIAFYVKDDGMGISADKQGHIFEHFMQEDPMMTRKFEGSGLGLSIAKGIVNLLGGEIWVESESGKGSKFTFSVRS